MGNHTQLDPQHGATDAPLYACHSRCRVGALPTVAEVFPLLSPSWHPQLLEAPTDKSRREGTLPPHRSGTSQIRNFALYVTPAVTQHPSSLYPTGVTEVKWEVTGSGDRMGPVADVRGQSFLHRPKNRAMTDFEVESWRSKCDRCGWR